MLTQMEWLKKDQQGWSIDSRQIHYYIFRLDSERLEPLEVGDGSVVAKETPPTKWELEGNILTVFKKCEPPVPKTEGQ